MLYFLILDALLGTAECLEMMPPIRDQLEGENLIAQFTLLPITPPITAPPTVPMAAPLCALFVFLTVLQPAVNSKATANIKLLLPIIFFINQFLIIIFLQNCK
jgi:hypothetical protein